MLRVGYSFWGFLGDVKIEGGKEISAPDGNATYSWSIIWELQRRGHMTWAMQKNRDHEAFRSHGPGIFSSFSLDKRTSAYVNIVQTEGVRLPDLDVLLLEWRWLIPGRNCEFTDDGMNFDPAKHQPDWKRQFDLLSYYKEKGTKIIIWDLDHKLNIWEEGSFKPDAIFETSVRPLCKKIERTRVEPPIVLEDLLQFETLPSEGYRKLVYIGSRYERDDVITKWIKPVSDRHPLHVQFWGNWTKSIDECIALWPNVSYHGRITTKDFRHVYGTAVAVPLLAKQSYLESGFITPRPWEALMFGSIPVGLGSHLGIREYLPWDLIAHDPQMLIDIVEDMAGWTLFERDRVRRELAEEFFSCFDVRHFVDKIERVANG